jgi:hypothetical protein
VFSYCCHLAVWCSVRTAAGRKNVTVEGEVLAWKSLDEEEEERRVRERGSDAEHLLNELSMVLAKKSGNRQPNYKDEKTTIVQKYQLKMRDGERDARLMLVLRRGRMSKEKESRWTISPFRKCFWRVELARIRHSRALALDKDYTQQTLLSKSCLLL